MDLYRCLRNYEFQQLNLEQIRISGKDFHGTPKTISPTLYEIGKTWEEAYKLIGRANIIIDHLSKGNPNYITNEKRISYMNEAILLRCFTYYNIAHLWGQAIYINSSQADLETILKLPVNSQDEIFDILLGELNKMETITQEENHINLEVAKALKAEMALWKNNKEDAIALLNDCEANFNILIDPNEAFYYNLFGDQLSNYSKESVSLLRKEANDELENLVSDWKSLKASWGYWAMLKRTKKAIEEVGCQNHEELMPIPMKEMETFPNMSQNPGY